MPKADRLVLHALAQDHEFVAADPGDGVGRAHGGAEAGRNGLEHLVTDVVTERVVDLFEIVDVAEQRGHGARLPLARVSV